MSLHELADIGQIIGGFAVVGSLIFVGLQIRQNTKSSRAATLQLNTDFWLNYMLTVADPKFRNIYAMGASGHDDLDQSQFGQFFLLCRASFMGLENQHYQYRYGLLDSGAYVGYQTTIREQVAAFPGIRAMWQLVRHAYGSHFVAFMDEQIAATDAHKSESAFQEWKILVGKQKGTAKRGK
jgi:hypothetical protein